MMDTLGDAARETGRLLAEALLQSLVWGAWGALMGLVIGFRHQSLEVALHGPLLGAQAGALLGAAMGGLRSACRPAVPRLAG